MKSKFRLCPEQIVQKVWGEEQIIVNKRYCGKILTLMEQHRCSMHYHKKKDETFFVISGLVLLEIGKEILLLHPGYSVGVKPGVPHRFTGLGWSKIVEFSTHHEDSDSCRTTQSEKVSDFDFKHLLEGDYSVLA